MTLGKKDLSLFLDDEMTDKELIKLASDQEPKKGSSLRIDLQVVSSFPFAYRYPVSDLLLHIPETSRNTSRHTLWNVTAFSHCNISSSRIVRLFDPNHRIFPPYFQSST